MFYICVNKTIKQQLKFKIMKTIKKQSRKVGVAGSFENQMMGNNSTTPTVGEGATILSYSDRHAYEVIKVSEDGLSCTIREMDTKNVGQCYGDERYTYHSNENNPTTNLEWDARKKSWVTVYYNVEIIKSLANKLFKQYGYGWSNFLPNNVKYDDLIDGELDGINTKLKLVDGFTKIYKIKNKVSIIFGVMEEYRDPSF